ncbi:sel1 repeat family protein [Sandaracinobacter neustonicus]|uniref:Sel1 repeat family protein n=1 Tax=Sandaracinobacter neustonicus TaxID=1715348 RepID=A0A501XIW8_9SPHN|nr:tetratricopeptide repeat protein [Sandaracinobacter neustonicus]TPE60582.1 sel1 repeat family protein [Sandaracinobacter neustonicus]
MTDRKSRAAVVLAGLLALSPIIPASAAMGPPQRPGQPATQALEDLPTNTLLSRGVAAFKAADYATARDHFRILAQRENPTAETLLGTMTAKGQGAAKDDAIAAAWYLRAARRGYAPAQLALADAFARGRGVPQDTARAHTLAKAAASQGLPGAAQLASRLGPERYAMLAGGRP